MSSSTTPNEDLAEEIDAVNAIYDPSTLTLTSLSSTSTSTSTASTESLPIQTALVLRIPDHAHVSSFVLGFDASYPSTPPRVLGTASTGTGSRGAGKKWIELLAGSVQRVWTPGAVCLFDVIVDVGDRIEREETDAAEGEEEGEGEGEGGEDATLNAEMSELALHGLDDPPDWTFSEVVKEKKSVFVARAVRVNSKKQAEQYLDYLLATEKKVAAATHNITAWRIHESTTTSSTASAASAAAAAAATVQDFDDDGETAAGGRLLHLMQLMDVWDVLVVVSRWFGGVKLGPDRFRLINTVARDALVKGGFDRAQTQTQTGGADGHGHGHERGKKKGKR